MKTRRPFNQSMLVLDRASYIRLQLYSYSV